MNLRILVTFTLMISSIFTSSLGQADNDSESQAWNARAALAANAAANAAAAGNANGAGALAAMAAQFQANGQASGQANGNALGLNMVQYGTGLSSAAEAGLNRGVSTQNYQLAPKYLTEKVVRKPRVITETVVQPVYKKTINRPSLLRERYTAVPNMVQSQTVVKNTNRTLGSQNSNASLNKTVNVPGNTVFVQPIVQPTLLVRTENVQVQASPAQVRRNAPQTLASRNTQATEMRTVNVPGGTIHNRSFVQPVLTREFVNVNVQRAPTRRINSAPVTAPVVVQNRTRNQRVVIPGATIYNQRMIQPRNTRERVRVNLVQSQPTTETREAIIKPTIRKRNVKTKYHNVVYRVPIQRTVQVVKPHYVRVNDVRTEFVPVDENGNTLSAAAAASVIGADGFAFNGGSNARYNMNASMNAPMMMNAGANMEAAALAQSELTAADMNAAQLSGNVNGSAMEAAMMNAGSSGSAGNAAAAADAADAADAAAEAAAADASDAAEAANAADQAAAAAVNAAGANAAAWNGAAWNGAAWNGAAWNGANLNGGYLMGNGALLIGRQ